uniref:(northern house mosquito) hypothetical protein n=1 Tax=Culex pipiens TaxID=7175 RepID=A0A8D8A0C5_CULPI
MHLTARRSEQQAISISATAAATTRRPLSLEEIPTAEAPTSSAAAAPARTTTTKHISSSSNSKTTSAAASSTTTSSSSRSSPRTSRPSCATANRAEASTRWPLPSPPTRAWPTSAARVPQTTATCLPTTRP